jgi:hypothetical protein
MLVLETLQTEARKIEYNKMVLGVSYIPKLVATAQLECAEAPNKRNVEPPPLLDPKKHRLKTCFQS